LETPLIRRVRGLVSCVFLGLISILVAACGGMKVSGVTPTAELGPEFPGLSFFSRIQEHSSVVSEAQKQLSAFRPTNSVIASSVRNRSRCLAIRSSSALAAGASAVAVVRNTSAIAVRRRSCPAVKR
jgi:hypothetical protein